MKHTTRRRFLELAPIAGTALIAACSPAPAPAPPPAPAPAPAPVPAPTPAPEPASSSPSSSSAPASGPAPSAAAGPMVDEKDPQAVALLYVSDAARVDKAKAPTFVPGSHCGNCALYQGGAADAGPCPLYPGKRVAAAGWCNSWNKKA